MNFPFFKRKKISLLLKFFIRMSTNISNNSVITVSSTFSQVPLEDVEVTVAPAKIVGKCNIYKR